jgi:hypothetical protein
MQSPISLCVLIYGDHAHLAARCLISISARLKRGLHHIADVRLGLNEISPATREVVLAFHNCVREWGTKVIHYDCPQNAFKYPLMRRMVLDQEDPVASSVMWFDDDSYLCEGWSWNSLLKAAAGADMMGKIYHQGMLPRQWGWISKQAWFNPAVGRPPRSKRCRNSESFRFCTGGWWMADRKIFLENDWPSPELKLIGGDSTTGELCRHQKYKLQGYELGVRINADVHGNHSKAMGRGATPTSSGGRGKVMIGNSDSEINLQDFVCEKEVFA